jgi:hypothetical protein
MHHCHFCQTAFELDLGRTPLGYFARGRCPQCGSVNVIVPGLEPSVLVGAGGAASAPAASTPIEVEAMDVDVVESQSGMTEMPEAAPSAEVPTGQVDMPGGEGIEVDEDFSS